MKHLTLLDELVSEGRYKRRRGSVVVAERKLTRGEAKRFQLEYFHKNPRAYGRVSKSIDDLTPLMQGRVKAFLAGCEELPFKVLLTSTYYPDAVQAHLYNRGRGADAMRRWLVSSPTSLHSVGLAFTFVPVVDSALIWDNIAYWRAAGAVAASVGLTWCNTRALPERDKVELRFL